MEQRLLKSLLNPEAYPEPASSVQLLQTHVSFLFITDNHVYKIKKPVDFGFLNFTTVDRRRFYCNEEVRLNRRLCPDLYLGVVEVRESSAGATFCGEGRIIDYAVKMQRLPADRMLDRLLADGKVTADHIREIARIIAAFHLNAERGGEIDDYGSIDSIHRNWEENFQQVREFVNVTVAKQDLKLIKEWVETFLAANEALFAERVSGGFIRDCDGDIHLENICLTDHVCIFDCIEFNNRFRYTDTTADIAFFLMDLDYHERTDFTGVFLDEYITVTGDRDVARLLDFYKIYRAVVRGKVESLRLHDPHLPEDDKNTARAKAVRYFQLARGYVIRQKLPPSLIITCGLMGSGKSTTAKALAFELGTEIVSSDPVRKELAGVSKREHHFAGYAEGIYSRSYDEATYGELLARSERALAAGRSIIVDATFRKKSDRTLFRTLAARLGCSFHIIQTDCPEKLVKKRLDARLTRPGEMSDGRWELFARQKSEFEPPDCSEGNLIIIDTSGLIHDILNEIVNGMGLC